jgi:hypothetical protein
MPEHSYTLMHGNTPCANIVFDDEGKIEGYRPTYPGYTPFLGNCDTAKFTRWWSMRAIPASRTLMKQVMRDAGILTPEEYLVKNLALSITDAYWICPLEARLSYDDVRFTNFIKHGGIRIPYHNATSYDVNASLGGKMDKYWDLSGDVPVLVKESYHNFGQQAVNEVFATRIHKAQETDVPFVEYSAARTSDGILVSKCQAFTSEKAELIPAYEIIGSRKIKNDSNLYQAYIDIAEAQGIDRAVMQNFMDYQTLTDFLISNTDEHLLNFGILRDPETMRLLGPAPIYDSGNSMFYSENRIQPYSRAELLERQITSFYKTEEKMLANVSNKCLLRLDRIPSPGQVMEFYTQAGIPEEKAQFISKNYETKVAFLEEFQHGKKVSLFQEKQKEKQGRRHPVPQKQTGSVRRFIMIAGISGNDRQEKAEEILDQFQKDGFQVMDSAGLYPAGQADIDCAVITDPYKIAAERIPQMDDSHIRCVVYVSADQIREEREKNKLPHNEDLVFAAVYARIRQAALNGDSIVFSAANLESHVRRSILQLLPHKMAFSKELIVVYSDAEKITNKHMDQKYAVLAAALQNDPLKKTEGWDKITKFRVGKATG